jgi:hypothetical protein
VPTVTGGTPTYQYAWSNGATSAGLVNIPAGSYVLTVSDAAGCFDFWNFSVVQPQTALTATWTTDSTASGWTVVLSPQGGTPLYNITWDAATGGQTGPSASGLATGVYAVTISDANDCALILQIPVGSVSSSKQPDVFAGVLLAPNPTAGRFRLTVELGIPSALDIQVFSSLGQLVTMERILEKNDRHEVRLDLGSRPPGIYRVLMRLDNGQYRVLPVVKVATP